LEKVSISLKTLLRDQKLYRSIQAIRDTMPEAQMIIADDGEMTEEKDGIYADLIREGHQVIILPFDSGFGMKSNRIAAALNRPYLLISSDDFDHRPPEVRKGIEQLLEVLENTDMDIASGRVNNGAYEFNLEFQDGGSTVIEHAVRIQSNPKPWFVECDLTVNYGLYKKQVFKSKYPSLNDRIHWLDDVKIGGAEHSMIYIQAKQFGYKVCYVPGVNINEQREPDSARYRQYRMRSGNPERPCHDYVGVKKYILGSGQVDYDVTARRS